MSQDSHRHALKAQPEHSQRLHILQPGALIEGKYRVERYLAGGGMGSIYKAVQEPLGRDVAIKLLKHKDDDEVDAEARQRRFFREARVASQLNHPHTITIYDYGELSDDRGFFLVMEFLDGITLRQHLDRVGAMGVEEVLHVAIQIAESLEDAHKNGVIHRDLKPPNVMLVQRGHNDLFVKVVDFGLVKQLQHAPGDEELTQEDMLLGSPLYMAPERILEQNADSPAADIYAFGIILYEALVGRPPFVRDADSTMHRVVLQHVQEPVPPMRTFNAHLALPPGLEDLIMSCVAKDPRARPASMGELAESLRRYLVGASGEHVSMRSSGMLQALGPSARSAESAASTTGASVRYSSSPYIPVDTPDHLGPTHETVEGRRPVAPTTASSPAIASPHEDDEHDGLPVGVVALVAVLVVAAGLGAYLFATRTQPADGHATTITRTGAGATTASSQAQAGAAPTEEPARVKVTSTPSGARVYCAGKLLGKTPLDVIPSELSASQLVLKLDGHDESVTELPHDPKPGATLDTTLTAKADPNVKPPIDVFDPNTANANKASDKGSKTTDRKTRSGGTGSTGKSGKSGKSGKGAEKTQDGNDLDIIIDR